MKRASIILLFLLIIISSECFAYYSTFRICDNEDDESDYGELDIEPYKTIKYDEEDNNFKMLYTGEYIYLFDNIFGYSYNSSDPCFNYFSVDGDLFAKDVGVHRLTISLRDKENYRWCKYDSDLDEEVFDTEDIVIEFEIYENSPDSVKKPQLSSNKYRWTGKERNVQNVFGYDSNYMKISGTYKATEIGQYTYKVSLKDKKNMKWEDGTTDDITATWQIIPIYLIKPSLLIDKLQFNGKNQTILLSNFKEETMKLVSGNSAWLIGNYTVTIALKDSEHYSWREIIDGEEVYSKDNVNLQWSIVSELEPKWELILKDGQTAKYPYDGSEKHFTYDVSFYQKINNVTRRVSINIDSIAQAVNNNSASELGDYDVEYKLLYPDSFVWVDRRGGEPTTNNRTIKYSIVEYDNQGWVKLFKYYEDDKIVIPYVEGQESYIQDYHFMQYVFKSQRINNDWFPIGGLHPAYEITGDTSATEPGDYQITISLIDDENGDLVEVYDYTNSEVTSPTPQSVSSYTINWKIVDNYEEYMENLNKPESEEGDLNNDDAVNIIDVKLLLKKVISNQTGLWNEDELLVCDLNKDNDINIIDVKLLLQKVISNI